MKKIVLHGKLADHVPGGVFECEFHTAREAASALELNFPGFFALIRDMYIHVLPGNDPDQALGVDEVVKSWKVGTKELHIMPAVEGAGGGGGSNNNGNRGLKAILGLALIAVAIVGTGALIGGGSIANLANPVFGNAFGITGLQLAQLGVALLMSAFAQPPPSEENDTRIENVIFTGPFTTNKEGEVLPYVAGKRIIVGGVIINTELIVENSA